MENRLERTEDLMYSYTISYGVLFVIDFFFMLPTFLDFIKKYKKTESERNKNVNFQTDEQENVPSPPPNVSFEM